MTLVDAGIKRRTACEKTIRQMIAQEEVGRRLGFQGSDRRNQVCGHNRFIITLLAYTLDPEARSLPMVRRRWYNT